ncbi:MAG TPA: hypothetical protein PLS49_07495, partial [Candidatus Woesebacteria bacterium]|nr:hypothetical protein [Candidatus Woesebacteria bacterium]
KERLVSIKHKFVTNRRKFYTIIVSIGITIVVSFAGYFIAQAVSLSLSDPFDNPEKIASKNNMTICGGQV